MEMEVSLLLLIDTGASVPEYVLNDHVNSQLELDTKVGYKSHKRQRLLQVHEATMTLNVNYGASQNPSFRLIHQTMSTQKLIDGRPKHPYSPSDIRIVLGLPTISRLTTLNATRRLDRRGTLTKLSWDMPRRFCVEWIILPETF